MVINYETLNSYISDYNKLSMNNVSDKGTWEAVYNNYQAKIGCQVFVTSVLVPLIRDS